MADRTYSAAEPLVDAACLCDSIVTPYYASGVLKQNSHCESCFASFIFRELVIRELCARPLMFAAHRPITLRVWRIRLVS